MLTLLVNAIQGSHGLEVQDLRTSKMFLKHDGMHVAFLSSGTGCVQLISAHSINSAVLIPHESYTRLNSHEL